MTHRTKLVTKNVPTNLMHFVQKAIFQWLPAACSLTLLTMHLIKCFFLANTSPHGALVMQSFDIIRQTCAAVRLIVVCFFNMHCNIVVVVVGCFWLLAKCYFWQAFFFLLFNPQHQLMQHSNNRPVFN